MFLVYNTFFRFTQEEMKEFTDYTGSIHVGIDTAAGDYRLTSDNNDSANYVYGIKDKERQAFNVVSYQNNDIIQLRDGQHVILYEASLLPIDSKEQAKTTEIVDQKIEEYTVDNNQTDQIDELEYSAGTVKIKNSEYNSPYVVTPVGEDAYFEMYDSSNNLTKLNKVTYEQILTISPQDATYIKFNDVEVKLLSDYVSTKGFSGSYYEEGVYVIGRSLEPGNYQLTENSTDCQYRIIDESKEIIEVPMNDCSELPLTVELTNGTTFEFHGVNVEKVQNQSTQIDNAQ